MSDDPTQPGGEEIPVPAALRRLRQSLRSRRDLLTTGFAGRQLAAMAADPGARISDMVDLSFADPAIAVRLIRMANSSTYDTRDRSDVVSVARAIALLGFEQTRSYSRSLPTLSDTVRQDRIAMVRTEMAATTFTARFARNLLDTRNPLVSDEGALTVIIARLWPVLSAMHVPHEMAALRYVQRNKPKLASTIHRELFHEPVTNLSREIVESWSLPRSCLAAINRSELRPSPVMAGRDWLPLAIGLALSVGEAIRLPLPEDRKSALQGLVARYRHCIELDAAKLTGMIEECAFETIGLERSIGVSSDECAAPALLQPHLKGETYEEPWWTNFERVDATGVIARLRADQMRRGINARDEQVEMITRLANGKPTDSQQRLQTLSDDIEQLSREYASAERDGLLNDQNTTPAQRISARVTPLLLEGLRGALGYDHVTWFERGEYDDLFLPKLAVGLDVGRCSAFCNQRLPADDLFIAAIRNRVDLHIADCSVKKISTRLPPWFNQVLPGSHSFLLMPLFTNDQIVGFILGDRTCTDPDGLEESELNLIRKMRGELTGLYDEFCAVSEDTAQ
jgi:hypothetical protein